MTGSWVLEKEFEQDGPGKLSDPMDIEVSPSGTVAVVDHDEARLQVYDVEGQHIHSIDTTQGLRPKTRFSARSVAVNSEGDYHVTDKSSFVKVFYSSGLFKDTWVTRSPENKPSDTEDVVLIGLAVDSKDQVLVGEVGRKYISIHKKDGAHITSIRVNIRPYSIAVTPQDKLIVSCHNTNKVVLVDITGHVLHTFIPPPHITDWVPRDVRYYEDIILICNLTSSSPGIYCFSSSGEFLRAIDTKVYPCHCAFGNRKLYVTYQWMNGRVEIYSCK